MAVTTKTTGKCNIYKGYTEQLFHQTKNNPNPKFGKFFGLGTKFYKFPSYLRRAAINDAIGHVSSFHSRYYSWQGGTRKRKTAKPPVLNTSCGVYPDLYKNQCIKIATDYSQAEIKVYKNNDWQWSTIKSVYARGTSSTAYDGTGEVKRDKNNYALGSFSTKKRYSIDLSASYNIAARHIAHKLKLATKHGKLLVSQSSDSKPRSWVSLSSLWENPTLVIDQIPRLQPQRA
jgi:hypothetical protein